MWCTEPYKATDGITKRLKILVSASFTTHCYVQLLRKEASEAMTDENYWCLGSPDLFAVVGNLADDVADVYFVREKVFQKFRAVQREYPTRRKFHWENITKPVHAIGFGEGPIPRASRSMKCDDTGYAVSAQFLDSVHSLTRKIARC
jgi:hypothetical protein